MVRPCVLRLGMDYCGAGTAIGVGVGVGADAARTYNCPLTDNKYNGYVYTHRRAVDRVKPLQLTCRQFTHNLPRLRS